MEYTKQCLNIFNINVKSETLADFNREGTLLEFLMHNKVHYETNFTETIF